MLIFNHSPLYSKVNKISRIDNFFHPDKYKLGHLYNLTEDEEMQRLFDYNESLRNIYKAREDSRRSYIRERINPFRINQLVVVPLSKNNQRSEAGGTGLKSSVQSIFSVKDVSPTGCRTISLYNIRISGSLQYYGDPLKLEAGTPIIRGTLILAL